MSVKTLGRCPDCGAAAPILVVRGEPTEIFEHDCQARTCEASGCLVTRARDEMIRFPSGDWYCASHGLLTAARDLVSLHRDGDHTAMAALLDETVPAVLAFFPR
jgi:hypothetical protein